MRILARSSFLLLAAFNAFGQPVPDGVDKAPPAVDEALRARVAKFYTAFSAGKFKEAYLLAADDSQDAFFQLPKDQYKSFEIIKLHYSDDFTKAVVVTAVKADWRWLGAVTVTTFPVTSNWKVIDGQWCWYYVKPTMVGTPFSPSGYVPAPSDAPAKPSLHVPTDFASAAHGILTKVSVDKQSVRLQPNQTSKDEVHVRNEMPGQVSLKLDQPNIPGLKVTASKTDLQAHEEATVVFEWRLDDPAIKCLDCAKRTSGRMVVQLHIEPTGQVFPIAIAFENGPAPVAAPSQVPAPSQK
jgi:hypothetical protein